MTGDRSPYELLPAVYRIRDAAPAPGPNGALQALLAVIEEELARLRQDVDDLYDNWFIETCEEWLVPYLGELLGVPGLAPVPADVMSQRAFVAHTIGYRRRKGTAAVLQQLARDVTGWPAQVVEYFQLLARTVHLDHLRLDVPATVDLRDSDRLARLETPFGSAVHTAEVRHIDIRAGRYDIPYVGVHFWRLAAYAVEGADAHAVDAALGRWTFDPAGRDVPLFTRPLDAGDSPELPEAAVPAPLGRRTLGAQLKLFKGAHSAADDQLPLRIQLPDDVVPASGLSSSDLSHWQRPGAGGDVIAAVDPVLGRLTLQKGLRPGRVRVDYAYGFSGDVGAGPHDRRATLAQVMTASGTPPHDDGTYAAAWQVGVGRDADPVPGTVVRTLSDAAALWNTRVRAADPQLGIIAVLDSATYPEDVEFVLAPGDQLLVVAASWPAVPAPPGPPTRRRGELVAAGLRPHVAGTVTATGTGGQLVLDGLSVQSVALGADALTGLTLGSCTVLGDVAVDAPALALQLVQSICSAVSGGAASVVLQESIVHAGGDLDAVALDTKGADVEIDACTVLGRTTARSLVANNTIMDGVVDVERRQQGCARYSYLPLESRAPRRYHCQPVDEARGRAVAPAFTSMRPTDPSFCQLARTCPAEITTGADDEGEMGAFHYLAQGRREANLRSQLDTYLRFGLEAGIFFVT